MVTKNGTKFPNNTDKISKHLNPSLIKTKAYHCEREKEFCFDLCYNLSNGGRMNTGVYVFNNMIFDSWLNRKSDEILSKVDRETISNEDMLILILKAQTNHFHHMDDEFREEFKHVRCEADKSFEQIHKGMHKRFEQVDKQFIEVQEDMSKRFEQVDKRIENLDTSVNKRFEQVDKRFEQVDKRFDRLTTILMWQSGIMISLISGLYLKLFLG